MLLTVLTPTLNCRNTIVDTFRSVEALQTVFPGKIQHLIGDGGSNDGTHEFLSDYVLRNRWARSYTYFGLNIPATLNKLLTHAQGQWIAVLNGDDFFNVEALAAFLSSPSTRESPLIICGHVSVLSSIGELRGFRRCRIAKLDRFMAVNHPAMLVDRRVFDIVGTFNTRTPTAYDYVWTWRAFRASISFIELPMILAHVRMGGISERHAHRAAKEILREKVRSGCVAPAVRDYALARFKAIARRMLPARIESILTKRIRELKESIDHY